jgi:hypothetical protein
MGQKMKFAVFYEPNDQDIYDMTNLTEIEVVEAEDEDEAIWKVVGELMGLRIWALQVKDNVPLGDHAYIKEEWWADP